MSGVFFKRLGSINDEMKPGVFSNGWQGRSRDRNLFSDWWNGQLL